MNEEAKKILFLLKSSGYEGYIVGGAVRDYLLGFEPQDYDFATNALPEQIKEVFVNYKMFDYGINHGTITVLMNNHNYEITTYRTDGKYFDNRHPSQVSFNTNLQEDLSRRDFTINAMAYNNCLIDNHQGKEDLKRKIIKTVGNPEIRFQEDALRIMRALRFAAQLNFKIDLSTSIAIHKYGYLLKNIAIERIIKEIKILFNYDFINIFKEYYDIFLLIFKHLKVDQIKSLIELFKKVGDVYILKWACLFAYVPYNDIFDIANDLRLEKYLIKKIIFLNKIDVILPNDIIGARKLLSKNDYDDLKDYVLYNSMNINKEEQSKSLNLLLMAKDDCHSVRQLNINGYDLQELGIVDKNISKWLNRLLDKVMEEELINDYHNLKEYIIENTRKI